VDQLLVIAALLKISQVLKDAITQRRAIALLNSITETYAGSPVARQAACLRHLLASAKPDRETVQRHLQSFADAAVKAAQPRITKKMKTVAKTATKSRKTAAKAKPAKGGMRKRIQRGYQTAIFKCLSDYEKCCGERDWKACAQLMVICISTKLHWAWTGSVVAIATKYFSGH
jgi:hypothetical protein